MNRLGVLLLALLFLPAALPGEPAAATHVEPSATSGTQWWGGEDGGYHIRVGVTVKNTLEHAVDAATVRAELDLAELLTEAGWIHTDGSRRLLKGFEFDEDSVRVVRVSSLQNGRILANDPSGTRSGDDEALYPSLVVEGHLESTESGNRFTEPLLTVFWQARNLAAEGSSGDTQYFHVYLDTKTNGDHSPSGLTGADVGAVESIHWKGAGTTFYGAVPKPGPEDRRPVITVLGLYPDTHVDVDLRSGGTYVEHGQTPAALEDLDAGESVLVGLPTDSESVFRLLSRDKPFLAFVNSEGYVPSLTGGMAGREFLLQTGAPNADAPTSLNILSATGAAATVDVSGDAQFHVANHVNGRPYTVGLYANGADGGCNPRNLPAGTATLQPNTVYRLSASDDVLVQVSARGAAPHQQPTLEGGPVGTEFAFPLVESFFLENAGCRQARETRSWWALSDQASGASLSTKEPPPRRVDPSTGGDSHNAVPAAPEYAGPFHTSGGVQDMPLYAHLQDDGVVLSGILPGVRTAASGALAHRGGLGASGFGEAMAFAYYDETRIDVEVDRYLSGTTTETVYISEGATFRISDGEDGDLVDGWTIQSDRPIATYGLEAPPGYLASMPFTLLGEAGEAEYWGYLLDISSASGVEPQSKATKPGESVEYQFVVENRARDVDGTLLSDTAVVQIPPGTVPDGWDAVLDRSADGSRAVIPLAAGATETVTMTVTPPKAAAARGFATIGVTATSENNGHIQVGSSTVTTIRSSYAVGMWFDTPNGGQSQPKPADPGTEVEFTVVAQNLGTNRDTIEFADIQGLKPGWDAILTLGGQEVSSVTLDPDIHATLKLTVTPPDGVENDVLFLSLTGRSAAQSSAYATVNARVNLASDPILSATAPELTKLVAPGEEVAFPIRLQNTGAGAVKLDLEAAVDTPPGWSDARFYLVQPDGQRGEVTSINVRPGDDLTFQVAITAAEDALAGDLASVRALGRDPNKVPAFEISFSAVTAALHELTVTPSTTPLLASTDGVAKPFRLDVQNDGNLLEFLRVEAADIPAGWSLEVPEGETPVPTGTTQPIPLGLKGPVGAEAQSFTLKMRLRSTDGTVTPVELPVVVPDASGLLLQVGNGEPAQPGRAARVPVTVTNAGNAPVTLEVREADGEAWTLAGWSPETLGPGSSTQIQVGWLVPARTGLGPSEHALQVVLVRDDGSESVRTVTATLDVDRPQVRVRESKVAAAPGGTLVTATLENLGNRSAHDVLVQLRAGSTVVDETLVQVLTAGDTAVIGLLDRAQRDGLTIVVDPDDAIAEGNEVDNVLSVQADSNGAPGPGVVLVLLAVALVARVTSRSRR